MYYISDEVNDKEGVRGDLYVVFENEQDVVEFETTVFNNESIEELTGHSYKELVNNPFAQVDDHIFFFENWQNATEYSIVE